LRVFVGFDSASGRRHQIARTFIGTKREATLELAKMVTEVNGGHLDRDHSGVTFSELLDAWLEHIRPTRRPTTIHESERSIEARIRPALGHIRLDRLSPRDLDVCYAKWLAGGLSASSVRRLHAVISASLNTAERWGWVANSPARRCSPPPVHAKEVKTPTPEQLNRLYSEANQRDPVLATAIALAALTGARRGELCALRWSDIDLAVSRLRLARSLTSAGSELFEGPTKTHQVRDVALDDVGVGVLTDRWQEMSDIAEQVGAPLVDDPYVLSYDPVGREPVDPGSITSSFSRLCRALEAPARERAKGRGLADKDRWPFRFHDLRHFSVTTLIAAGVDIRTVAERHGHAQATMTLNRYAHALPERDRHAATVLGDTFTSTRASRTSARPELRAGGKAR
jgi:integrase